LIRRNTKQWPRYSARTNWIKYGRSISRKRNLELRQGRIGMKRIKKDGTELFNIKAHPDRGVDLIILLVNYTGLKAGA
jgi:hypothetical protein